MNKLLTPLLAVGAVAVGVLFAGSGSAESEGGSADDPAGASAPVSVGTVSEATASCPTAGYLCANVEEAATVRVRRGIRSTGTLVGHIPAPDFELPADAARLQSAAAAGVRAWNGHPFPVRVEARTPEGAHFAVRWVPTLDGDAVGVARTRWSTTGGLEVTSIDLATRNPFAPDVPIDSERVRLTAAHEMGHALGLPHSDSDRDVMYPMNTAYSLTARDYRSMEALYALPDGAVLEP